MGKSLFVGLLVLVLLSVGVPPVLAQFAPSTYTGPTAPPTTSYLLSIPNISGESKAAGHAGWIDVRTYSLPVGHLEGGPGMVGTPTVYWGPLVLIKSVDASTPKLMDACARNADLGQAVFEVSMLGDAAKCRVRYTLSGCKVESVKEEIDAHGNTDERLTLTGDALKVTYTRYDSQGKPAGVVETTLKLSTK